MIGLRNNGRARAGAILACWLALTGFGGIDSLFVPETSLWARWSGHDEAMNRSVDHKPWQAFLDAFVTAHEDGVNRIAYGRVDAAARKRLDSYIADLTAVAPTKLRRAEQLAYWINLYNALTARTVLRHYPVESIRDINISPGLFSVGPWGKKLVEIEGEAVSLNDIEHRILRPIWQDARLHYALNCAAIGCPNLQKTAFTADNTDEMLESAARAYVNDRRGMRFDGETAILSSIYAWYIADFGGNLAGVVAHLKRYADKDKAARLDAATEFEDAYDWALNDSGNP